MFTAALSIIGLAMILERAWTLWKIRLDIQHSLSKRYSFVYKNKGL